MLRRLLQRYVRISPLRPVTLLRPVSILLRPDPPGGVLVDV